MSDDICGWCDEPIGATEEHRAIPHYEGPIGGVTQRHYHLPCVIRLIIGGINHQNGLCTCCGGTLTPDKPGRSKREAAREAASHWMLSRPREQKSPAG